MANFTAATPERSGVVDAHIAAIHRICQRTNTFLFLRPSTVPTMRLIREGFATKSMDVHDKSSDWGLTSGLVPCDQAFSKALRGTPNADPHFHGHGQAQVVHLNLALSFEGLFGQGHFEHLQELRGDASTETHGSAEYRHFHCAAKNRQVNFAMRKTQGRNGKAGDVFWYWRDNAQGGDPRRLVPVYVWGYKGVPVTGDYDMWMVAPHVSVMGGKTTILSNKDAHGRSAAGAFTSNLIGQLNGECGRAANPVFNHGAEAQNVSFTQLMDRYLALFGPGRSTPIMVPRMVVGAALHDLLLRGYVAIRNPKWIGGSTLGVEDMADAAGQFPGDGAVRAGVAARNQLETNAANHLKRVFFAKGSSDGWKERYNQLRYFRILSRASEMDDVENLVVLPETIFPNWGPGSIADARDEARRLAREAERSFKRTGFTQEDGHVSPVDETVGANPGRANVNGLRQFWESQKGR